MPQPRKLGTSGTWCPQIHGVITPIRPGVGLPKPVLGETSTPSTPLLAFWPCWHADAIVVFCLVPAEVGDTVLSGYGVFVLYTSSGTTVCFLMSERRAWQRNPYAFAESFKSPKFPFPLLKSTPRRLSSARASYAYTERLRDACARTVNLHRTILSASCFPPLRWARGPERSKATDVFVGWKDKRAEERRGCRSSPRTSVSSCAKPEM